MSSSGNPNTDGVAQVTQALQDSSLQGSSQVRAAANAAPLSTSCPGRMMSSPFQQGQWPKDWYGDDVQSIERKALRHLLEYDHYLKEKGAKFASFTVMGDDGKVRKPWCVRRTPRIPPFDKDTRFTEKINDVFTASVAYKDTANIFRREIELSRAGDNAAWVEGQMLGEADPETKAPISVSKDFILPGHNTDTRSSTSRGHEIPHMRPPGEGAGWGGYDKFHAWQANGRSINKDWVDEGDWQEKKIAPLKFTDEETGEVEIVPYSKENINDILERTANYKTLHEKLADSGKTNQTVSNQGGRGGQASVRGGRGGRRGRGGRGGRGATSFW
ncbi:hypothetical protein FBEOM_5967 [Fusarium beomiforme]|uniref:Uncharacterized protein n=1 Tax=Fusarium beomiforme TaxID=44412 RepID=A0A9P5DWL9_9HYPO|nr:hypothetical protein FBEOM_5967 [Fusarium beomiforme]